MLTDAQRKKVLSAFQSGTLRIESVAPSGIREWKQVLDVSRAEVFQESIVEVTTPVGSSVLTGGHRVFISPTEKTEAENLAAGIITIGVPIVSIRTLESRQYMYDLTAADWHNFVLAKSGLVVSNSPDRNYHFRPPSNERTVQQYSRVFGYVWEAPELQEYLDRALDMIIAYPPRTPFANVESMIAERREWTTLLTMGAMIHAYQAVRTNWIVDEFSVQADTKVTVVLPTGKQITLPIAELHSIVKP